MSDSTLILEPVWLFVLFFGVLVFVVIGMFTPYISAEDQEKAKKSRRILGVSPNAERVNIAMKCRINLDAVAVYLVSAWIVVVDVLFLVESFSDVVTAIGYGIVGAVLGLLGMLIASLFIFVGTEAVMALAACLVELELEKYYTRAYHANIIYVYGETGAELYRIVRKMGGY